MSRHSAPSVETLPPGTEKKTGIDLKVTPAFSPLYQQIKSLILNGLRLGEWKPGEAIPSEIELASRFRVSQGTVRKAIDELAGENLLSGRQYRMMNEVPTVFMLLIVFAVILKF